MHVGSLAEIVRRVMCVRAYLLGDEPFTKSGWGWVGGWDGMGWDGGRYRSASFGLGFRWISTCLIVYSIKRIVKWIIYKC
jgi:hypothetical protein